MFKFDYPLPGAGKFALTENKKRERKTITMKTSREKIPYYDSRMKGSLTYRIHMPLRWSLERIFDKSRIVKFTDSCCVKNLSHCRTIAIGHKRHAKGIALWQITIGRLAGLGVCYLDMSLMMLPADCLALPWLVRMIAAWGHPDPPLIEHAIVRYTASLCPVYLRNGGKLETIFSGPILELETVLAAD